MHAQPMMTADSKRGTYHPRIAAEFAGRRVLVVEPDAALRLFLQRELASDGLGVTLCADGEQAVAELRDGHFDLVLQAMDLPGMDGMVLLHTLRTEYPSLPVMVLTRRARTEDRVQALEHGALDYIVKPFSFRELHARVRCQLRRTASAPTTINAQPAAQEGLSLSKPDRRVRRGDRQIDLTPREFALLEHLVEHEGQAVSRATLMEEVWNAPFDPSTNIIDVYMKYLRDKIDGAGEKKLIRTVRGIGYMLDPTPVAYA